MNRGATISATHAGSLPRPPELLDLLYAREKGKHLDLNEFHALADAAVDDAVRRQVQAGIAIVSDGELTKPGFTSYIIRRMTGFERFHEQWPIPDLDDLPELFEQQYGGDTVAHVDLARLVGHDRVLPGTDCGFGTFAGFGIVHPKVAWMKLQALGEGAALASQRV